MRREYGIGDFPDQTNGGRGLAETARQVQAEEQAEDDDGGWPGVEDPENDHVVRYMIKNKIPLTQRNYLQLNYCRNMQLEDLDAEGKAMLPWGFSKWPVDDEKIH